MDTIYSMIYWIYDWIMTLCKTKCNNTIAPLHILDYNNELYRITHKIQNLCSLDKEDCMININYY